LTLVCCSAEYNFAARPARLQVAVRALERPIQERERTLNELIEPRAPDFEACECTYLAAVHMHGPEAAGFLHGQVSNDIKALDVHRWTLAAYCNPKGRIIAILQVIRTGAEDFLLLLPEELLEVVVKRLRMYVLRAKVKLEPVSRTAWGIAGEAAARAVFGTLPDGRQVLEVPGGLLLDAGFKRGCYLLLMQGAETPDGLKVDTRQDLWLSVLAENGIPEVFSETTGEFLPQGVNLDLLDAVNFRKGCYPGQEIVARLRYLGKLKQRAVRIRFEGAARPPGTSLYVRGTKAGQLVLCGTAAQPGASIGLASVNFSALAQGDPGFDDGTKVAIHHPPYAVPELEDPARE